MSISRRGSSIPLLRTGEGTNWDPDDYYSGGEIESDSQEGSRSGSKMGSRIHSRRGSYIDTGQNKAQIGLSRRGSKLITISDNVDAENIDHQVESSGFLLKVPTSSSRRTSIDTSNKRNDSKPGSLHRGSLAVEEKGNNSLFILTDSSEPRKRLNGGSRRVSIDATRVGVNPAFSNRDDSKPGSLHRGSLAVEEKDNNSVFIITDSSEPRKRLNGGSRRVSIDATQVSVNPKPTNWTISPQQGEFSSSKELDDALPQRVSSQDEGRHLFVPGIQDYSRRGSMAPTRRGSAAPIKNPSSRRESMAESFTNLFAPRSKDPTRRDSNMTLPRRGSATPTYDQQYRRGSIAPNKERGGSKAVSKNMQSRRNSSMLLMNDWSNPSRRGSQIYGDMENVVQISLINNSDGNSTDSFDTFLKDKFEKYTLTLIFRASFKFNV